MVTDMSSGRSNQKRRTRVALVRAARALLRAGGEPSLEEIAEAALVSRSTAYRYFRSREAILTEALLEEALGDAVGAIARAADAHDDVGARVEATVRADHAVVTQHEAAFRSALRHWAAAVEDEDAAIRRPGNRLGYLHAAAAPLGDRLSDEELDRLVHALAMMVGIESVVVLRDVCGLSVAQAEDLKCWAVRALLRGVGEGTGQDRAPQRRRP